ncbi:hypothetical protein GF342_03980 [Candidatus Woesearchaeota archaeon]|nr:hypothetical protein [Candidatus Woesearchaeota archaeon]
MTDIYSLKVQAQHCDATILLNGFPVVRGNVGAGGYPINPYLAGDNTLEVTLQARGQGAHFSGGINIAQKGGVVSTDRQQSDLMNFSFSKELEKGPLTKTFTFTSTGANFSNRLVSAPILEDKNALLDYAMNVQKAILDKDKEALQRHMKTKMLDYAKAFGVPDEHMLQELDNFIHMMFQEKPILFTREQVKATPWCDKRIWELKVTPDNALLRTKEGWTMPVFVGLVDGKITIVR